MTDTSLTNEDARAIVQELADRTDNPQEKQALGMVLAGDKLGRHFTNVLEETLVDKYIMAVATGYVANHKLICEEDAHIDCIISMGRELCRRAKDRERGVDQIPPITKLPGD